MLKTMRLTALGTISACGTANAHKLRATIPADGASRPLILEILDNNKED